VNEPFTSKKAQIKELIKTLHEGTSPDEAKKKFKSLLEDISPVDISKAEEELIEEGMPGFSKGRLLEKTGTHSQDTGELFFEDCRVPQENLLGEEGEGFHYLMYNLQQERLALTLDAQATAEYTLEKTIEYCKTRNVFGSPVSTFQHNTFKIVEMATEVQLGRVFLNSLIEDFIDGIDITLKVSMAKWWIPEMANRLAYHCTQLHGGYGCMKEYYVARVPGDLRSLSIAGGTTEIMKVVIGKMMGL